MVLYANVTFNTFNNYFKRDNGNRCCDHQSTHWSGLNMNSDVKF